MLNILKNKEMKKITLIGTTGPEMTRIEEFLRKNKVEFRTVTNSDEDTPKLIIPGKAFSYKGEKEIKENIDSIKSAA